MHGSDGSQMMTWATRQGSPFPLGATWIPEEKAYNFALYSKYAEKVTVLLYQPEDLICPISAYHFDGLKNKTGRIWHARIPKREMLEARYYAYSIDGPPPSGNRFEQYALHPEK